jgi:hypothetical protein
MFAGERRENARNARSAFQEIESCCADPTRGVARLVPDAGHRASCSGLVKKPRSLLEKYRPARRASI